MLGKMKVAELKELCRKNNITGIGSMKKDDLLRRLVLVRQSPPPPQL
jgi:hypothetical protein